MDQRESLDDIYGGSGNALNGVFQQHDFGHHVYLYRPTPPVHADLGEHIGERLEHDINKKHKDVESVDQHKYARLANASPTTTSTARVSTKTCEKINTTTSTT